MQCYSLPFGVIGWASHILILCTLAWIWEGSPLKRHPWRGTIIGSIILICSIVLANFAYIRCRNNRALSWIVIWRAFQSILLGCSVIIVSISKPETKPESQKFNTWMFPNLLVAMVGWIGLILLVHDNRHNPDVVKIMKSAIGPIITMGLSRISGWLFDQSSRHITLLQHIYWFGIGAPEYSDFVIGFASGNLLGVPISNNAAIYWGYFAANALALAILL
jgi:hypothetical protein